MFDSTSPWETSQAVGGDLTGTLTADRASGPTYAEALAPTPPVQETLPKQVASLGALQAEWQASKEQSEPFFKKLTINPQTGQVDISTTQGALADVFAQLKDLQTMKTAAMARVAQLRQQEASGSPILDALSQLAGGLAANDPTMPGWVRALGATSLQMGPQGIAAKRAAEEAKVIGLSKEIAGTSLDAAKIQADERKMRLAQAEAVRQDNAKKEKDRTDAIFKIHDDASQMIRTNGEFDARSTAKKMLALGMPQDQIVAEIEDLQSFAEAQKKYMEAKENRADGKETNRLKALAEVAGARIGAREEAEYRTREHAFKMKVMSESKPPAVVDTAIREASQSMDTFKKALELLDDPEVVKKFGFGKGWFATRKPFAGSEEQKMLSVSLDTLTDAAKAAGLKPLSDTDLQLLKMGIFDPNKSPEANRAAVEHLKRKVENLVSQLMDYYQAVDWAAKKDGLPEFARSRIPEAMERRRVYFMQYAPPGVEIPETPYKPDAPPSLPKKKGESVKVGNVTIVRN